VPWSSSNPSSLFDFDFDFLKGSSEGVRLDNGPLYIFLFDKAMILYLPFLFSFDLIISCVCGLTAQVWWPILQLPVGQRGTCRNHLVAHTQVRIARSSFIARTLISGLVAISSAPRKD